MRNYFSNFIVLAIMALMFSMFGTTALAGEVGIMYGSELDIVWEPVLPSPAVVLNVTGAGDYSQREVFGEGEAPFFSVYDADNELLWDGQYRYNLRASTSSDGLPPFVTQTGTFRIENGRIVVPEAEEED